MSLPPVALTATCHLSPAPRSSPLVTLGTSISPTGSPGRGRTGVAWDPAMLQHSCLCGDTSTHPESPGRLERVLARLAETGLLARWGSPATCHLSSGACHLSTPPLPLLHLPCARCELVRRIATAEELASCHEETHVQRLLAGTAAGLSRLPCGGWGMDSDTVLTSSPHPSSSPPPFSSPHSSSPYPSSSRHPTSRHTPPLPTPPTSQFSLPIGFLRGHTTNNYPEYTFFVLFITTCCVAHDVNPPA